MRGKSTRHARNSIPVDFEQDNKLYIIPVEDVVAVIRRGEAKDEP